MTAPSPNALCTWSVQVFYALSRYDHDAVRLRDAGSDGMVWEEWMRDVLSSRFRLRADTIRQYESLMRQRAGIEGDISRSNKRRSATGPSSVGQWCTYA
eukprot:1220-Eustigmatos_ZCMA.PRE.1